MQSRDASEGVGGEPWTERETKDLVRVWSKKMEEVLRPSRRKRIYDGFQRIAEQMASFGYRRSALECRAKIAGLRLEYKRAFANNIDRFKTPRTSPFYSELDWILQGDGIPKPMGEILRSTTIKLPVIRGPTPLPISSDFWWSDSATSGMGASGRATPARNSLGGEPQGNDPGVPEEMPVEQMSPATCTTSAGTQKRRVAVLSNVAKCPVGQAERKVESSQQHHRGQMAEERCRSELRVKECRLPSKKAARQESQAAMDRNRTAVMAAVDAIKINNNSQNAPAAPDPNPPPVLSECQENQRPRRKWVCVGKARQR